MIGSEVNLVIVWIHGILQITRVDLQRAMEEEREEQRLRWLDKQCETISPAEAMAWLQAEQKERL